MAKHNIKCSVLAGAPERSVRHFIYFFSIPLCFRGKYYSFSSLQFFDSRSYVTDKEFKPPIHKEPITFLSL